MPSAAPDALVGLHQGLVRREMPETVARQLLELPAVAADATVADALRRVARGRRDWSSMSEDWFEPVAVDAQIATAHQIFARHLDAHAADPRVVRPGERDVCRLIGFIELLSESIAKAPGLSDFKRDRLDRAGRRKAGLDLTATQYTKRFRFLGRLEEHVSVYAKERRLAAYRIAGKAGLVSSLPFEDFAASPWSAAFTAWYAARKRRRSVFTNDTQSRPFDAIAKLLLDRCEAAEGARWDVIARVFPERRVLARLDDARKAALLSDWTNLLGDIALDLKRVFERSALDLETMTVRRGDDSSTWNIAAQAWNTARTAWMALLADIGQEGLLEHLCPGKTLRFMAGDVTAWHRSGGDTVHPDTLVWCLLPKPWAVMAGGAVCGRKEVEQACLEARIDPRGSGWIEARVSMRAEPFQPTPELVHGVSVGSPLLAHILRKAGAFSGKSS